MRDNEGIVTDVCLVGLQVDIFYQENSKWYMILLVKTMTSDAERFCRNTVRFSLTLETAVMSFS